MAGQPSNEVDISFPSAAGCPAGSTCPAPGITSPSASIAPYPFIRIDIVDRIAAGFTAMVTGAGTVDIRTYSVCGLAWAQSPVPVVVLSPVGASALTQSGTPAISIAGGPVRSIQVNSSSPSAVTITSIDLSKGGPDFNGSDMGVFGGPSTPPSGFVTANSGAWRYPSSPFMDPFAMTATPSAPSAPAVPSDLAGSCARIPCSVAYRNAVHGCPDPSGCVLYTAGYYSSGITVKDATAVFDPGLYYVNNGIALQSNSLVRPGTGTGDGTNGTVFYLTGSVQKCSGQTGLICVGSNSGKSGVDPFNTSLATCPGGTPPDSRIGLPATLSGSVLLAPCNGTCGDISGAGHGILFFQDRSLNSGGGWGGGGGFLLAGSMYLHHCNPSGTGTGCSTSAYDSSFTLQGNSGSSSFILGNIITDTLSMGGGPTVTMALNPNASANVIKAAVFF